MKTKNVLILIVVICCAFSTSYIGVDTEQKYQSKIDSLNFVINEKEIEIEKTKEKIEIRDSVIINLTKKKVTATMYYPVESQCDDTPNITACGIKFDVNVAGSYKYIAMSREMLSRWGGVFRYGDLVAIKNAGHKNGIYKVVDTMNKRFTDTIDFLEDINSPLYKYEDVMLFKYFDFLSPYV